MNQQFIKAKKYINYLTTIEKFTLVLIVVAIFFRFFQLGQIPVSTYWDETAMMVDLKTVLVTGQDMHGLPWSQTIYPSYGDYKLPAYIWLSLIPSWLLGVSPLVLRLVSAVAGLATIVIATGIGRRLAELGQFSAKFKGLVSLSIALVVAISPWSFMFSRTAFEGHLSQVILAGAVWLFLSLPSNWWRAVLAGSLGALSIYTYYATRFVWFPVAILGGVLLFSTSNQQKLRKLILQLLLALIISTVLLVPLLKSPWYQPMQQFRLNAASILNPAPDQNQINQIREWSGNTLISRVLFNQEAALAQAIAKNYASHLNLNTLFLLGDDNLRHNTTQHGLFLAPFVIPLFAGIYVLSSKGRILFFIVGWWLFALLPASVPMDVPHALRSLNALLPLSIIMGFGLAFIVELLHRSSKWFKLIFLCWFSWMLIAFFSFIYFYFQVYPEFSAEYWQSDLPQLVNIINEKIPVSEPQLILTDDDKVFLYLMAYGNYSTNNLATWPESQFIKTSGENVFFSSQDLNNFLEMSRKTGRGWLIIDPLRFSEVWELLNKTQNITCQDVSLKYPAHNYQLCQVSGQ